MRLSLTSRTSRRPSAASIGAAIPSRRSGSCQLVLEFTAQGRLFAQKQERPQLACCPLPFRRASNSVRHKSVPLPSLKLAERENGWIEPSSTVPTVTSAGILAKHGDFPAGGVRDVYHPSIRPPGPNVLCSFGPRDSASSNGAHPRIGVLPQNAAKEVGLVPVRSSTTEVVRSSAPPAIRPSMAARIMAVAPAGPGHDDAPPRSSTFIWTWVISRPTALLRDGGRAVVGKCLRPGKDQVCIQWFGSGERGQGYPGDIAGADGFNPAACGGRINAALVLDGGPVLSLTEVFHEPARPQHGPFGSVLLEPEVDWPTPGPPACNSEALSSTNRRTPRFWARRANSIIAEVSLPPGGGTR